MTENLILRVAGEDPLAASKALGTLADPSPEIYRQIARGFGDNDPQEGLSWAQSLSPERHGDAVRMILLCWFTRRGPEPARQWVEASSLAPELKEEMLRNLRRK